MSQVNLPVAIEVVKNTVSVWERGVRLPQEEYYPVIAEAQGISVFELLGLDDSQVGNLTEEEAAAMADAEEQEELELMARNYRKLLPQHQEIVRTMFLHHAV